MILTLAHCQSAAVGVAAVIASAAVLIAIIWKM